jgi:RNA recognition motif-containing protein
MDRILRVDQATEPGQKNRTDKRTNKLSVFVGHIPFDSTEEEVRGIFEVCGPIHHVRIPRNEKGQGRGIAYVTFQEEEAVPLALRFDKAAFRNQTIAVQRSDPIKAERTKLKHEAAKAKGKGKGKGKERQIGRKKETSRKEKREEVAEKTEFARFEGRRVKTCPAAERLLFRNGKSWAETGGLELSPGEHESRRLWKPLLGLVRGQFRSDGEDLLWTVKKPDRERGSRVRNRVSNR